MHDTVMTLTTARRPKSRKRLVLRGASISPPSQGESETLCVMGDGSDTLLLCNLSLAAQVSPGHSRPVRPDTTMTFHVHGMNVFDIGLKEGMIMLEQIPTA